MQYRQVKPPLVGISADQVWRQSIAVAEKFEDVVYANIHNCSYTNFPVHAMD